MYFGRASSSDLYFLFMNAQRTVKEAISANNPVGLVPGIHHMGPVLRGVQGKLLEPLDEKHAGVADVPAPGLAQLEAPGKELLVLAARREPGAAGLGSADAAAICGPVNQALVQG